MRSFRTAAIAVVLITAYDLNKGTILWQIPDGEVPGIAPGSHAPRGGPVVTAGG